MIPEADMNPTRDAEASDERNGGSSLVERLLEHLPLPTKHTVMEAGNSLGLSHGFFGLGWPTPIESDDSNASDAKSREKQRDPRRKGKQKREQGSEAKKGGKRNKAKTSKESKESKESKVLKGSKASKEPNTTKEPKATKEAREDVPEELAGSREPKEDTAPLGNTSQKVKKYLHYLTRYISDDQENMYLKDKKLTAKYSMLTTRVDGEMRFASPFEAVCGGDQSELNESFGHDGPTQYLHFINAAQFPESGAKDCALYWDKGQRRVRTNSKSVQESGAFIFDLSLWDNAFKWCYHGGCLTSRSGRLICFQGAKNVKPWPYLCANSVYQTAMRNANVKVPASWWTTATRKEFANKCATWATTTREVLVLPDPDSFYSPDHTGGIIVETDRPPIPRESQCYSSKYDKCTTINPKTQDVCCCSQKCSKVPCPKGVGRQSG